MKILLADLRPEFPKAIKHRLDGLCDVKAINDGAKVLELCRTYEPDILVLDMELPRMDGLSILRAIKACERKINVIAITVCAESEYAMRQLVQAGVEYILPKPCTVTAVASRLYEMISMRSGREWSLEDEINSLMLSLGMRMNLSGYFQTCDAVKMMLGDNTNQITKAIYPELAAKYGNSPAAVERVIRNVINDAWERRDDNVWKMYFKPDRNGEIPRPSNSYFVSRMSMCVEKRKIG